MFATVGSSTLAYDVVGEPGPTFDLLLIHAGVTDRRSWRPLIDALDPGRRIVCYDQRGYGETTYTPERYTRVGDALAVMDAAGLSRAIVVGASNGGRVALDLALTNPERVVGLVLIGTAVSGAPPDDGNYPEPLASFDKALTAAYERKDLDKLNRLEAHLWLDGPTAVEGRVGGEARELFLEMNAKALAAEDPGDEPGDADAWSRLEELAMPVLVLVGSLDLAHVREHSRLVADRVPAARLVELDGVAHLPHLESDPACLQAIADFVDALVDPAAEPR